MLQSLSCFESAAGKKFSVRSISQGLDTSVDWIYPLERERERKCSIEIFQRCWSFVGHFQRKRRVLSNGRKLLPNEGGQSRTFFLSMPKFPRYPSFSRWQLVRASYAVETQTKNTIYCTGVVILENGEMFCLLIDELKLNLKLKPLNNALNTCGTVTEIKFTHRDMLVLWQHCGGTFSLHIYVLAFPDKANVPH